MSEHPAPENVKEMIARYEKDCMQVYAKISADKQPVSGDSWLDKNYPFPDFEADRKALNTMTKPSQQEFFGYMQVFVTTANGAQPLVDASVEIYSENNDTKTLFASFLTDISGLTPSVPLPSVDPALSLTPGNKNPYIPYSIRVKAQNYTTVIFRNVPVYGNNHVRQNATLKPVIDGNTQEDIIYRSGGPVTL